jgi:hypothetical protein
VRSTPGEIGARSARREASRAPFAAHVHALRPARDVGEGDAARCDEPRRGAGERRLDELREHVVRAGRERHDRRVGPGLRDEAVRAVAAQHEERAAAGLPHRLHRPERVARARLRPAEVDALAHRIDREVLERALAHAEHVRRPEDPRDTGLRRPDRRALELVSLRVRRVVGGAAEETPHVAARHRVHQQSQRSRLRHGGGR